MKLITPLPSSGWSGKSLDVRRVLLSLSPSPVEQGLRTFLERDFIKLVRLFKSLIINDMSKLFTPKDWCRRRTKEKTKEKTQNEKIGLTLRRRASAE